MPRLGNISVSSLLQASASALARQQSYEDSMAAYEYDLSARTAADFQKYSSYLAQRGKSEQDPSKQLALQKKIDTARNQYQSSEITRINTQINYGNMSLTDKRNALISLRDQALAIGDLDQAQSLEYQYTSVDKQIQNEAKAAASKGAGGGFDTEMGKGYSDKLKQFDEAEKVLKRQFAQGQITATQFAAGMSAINSGTVTADGSQVPGRQQVYSQLEQDQSGLSEDDAQKLYDKYTTFADSESFKKYNQMTDAQLRAGDIGFAEKRTQTGVDKNGKPVYTQDIVPLKKVGVDANGTPQFETGRTGDNTFVRNIRNAQGGIGKRAEDLFGVPGEKDYGYIQDEQGKRFIGKTITLPSGRTGEFTAKDLADLKSLEAANPKFNTGPMSFGQYFSDLTNAPADLKNSISPLAAELAKKVKGVGGPLNVMNVPRMIGSLFTADAKKRQQELEMAQAASRNATLQAEAARQKALLPVFQSPAYRPVTAPPPMLQKPKTQYSFTPTPLPGQPGYVNAVDKTKATIANPNSTARDALKALVGF